MARPKTFLEKKPHPIRALKDLVTANLITSVFAVLGVGWLAASWFVYQAEHKAQGANITSFADALWWGVVTFLTVGYGDRYPVTPEGRAWAGGLMFIGVFGVAIITSKISSYFLEQALREGRGVVNTSKLKGHFVVCGWKEDMHELLSHILAFNPDLSAKDIVLIANLSGQQITALHEVPGLKGLNVIAGDYYESMNIARAAPERARKVMILADRTAHANGNVPSVTEVDARTIMTAMTVANISKGTLIAAEILDPKMDQYLKLANVNEIIYSQEYSRMLLGNASGGTGVSNILFDLLDPKTPTLITTRALPEEAVGRPYDEYKPAFERDNPRCVLIGVLENTGNAHRIKEIALRQAQKTPDMGRLVQNLRAVKEIRCNHPVFNPGNGYAIPENSMAIVIETRALARGEARGEANGKEADLAGAA